MQEEYEDGDVLWRRRLLRGEEDIREDALAQVFGLGGG
jgi:hypothetical protein